MKRINSDSFTQMVFTKVSKLQIKEKVYYIEHGTIKIVWLHNCLR